MNRRRRVEIPLNHVETGVVWVPGMKVEASLLQCSAGVRHEGGVNVDQASLRNVGTCRPDAKGEAQAAETASARVPMRGTGAEMLVVGSKAV